MRKRYIWILIIAIIALSFSSAYYLKTNKSIVAEEQTSLDQNKEESIDEDQEEENIEEIEEKITKGTILATGDIMFHMPQVNSAYNSNEEVYDFNPVFKYVKEYISSADLSVGNFETVTAGAERGYSGYPMFNSPEFTLEAIKNSGFDILTTANNHGLDQGKEGLINTIENIEKYGMKNIGTYREPDTPILVEEVEGIELALLSYTYGFNGMEQTLTEEEQSYMINTIDENKIKREIEESKNLGVDMVVVFIHWGEEYQREPSEAQRDLGEKMVDWGANIIFGSHPHVVQETEIINKNGKDNFIIYSMGNFLSNQREEILNNPYTEDGIMVEVEFKKDFVKEETIIEGVKYIPTWVRKYNNSGTSYEILPVEDFLYNEELKSQLNDNEIYKIQRSFENTMEKMGDY